ncbi:MAG: DUF1697 domain-containing protein [Gemmatimonadaceae bacterium]
MPRCIAFLRAINVGGHSVKMPQLKTIFESLGFTEVETFIASGNVIFKTRTAPGSAMVSKIEKRLHDELGYEVETFVRTDAEVVALSQLVTFSEAEVASAHMVYVGFLGAPLNAAARKSLETFNTATELFRHSGSEIHFLTRVTTADSKFSNVKFERALGVPTTFRNVNTIARLASKYPPK